MKQESHQQVFDVAVGSLDDGRIVYACGSDLWLLDLNGPRRSHPHHACLRFRPDARALGEEAARLSDCRRTFRRTAPAPCLPRAAKSSLCPAKTGRIVKVAGDSGIRYREARFLPDGKNIVALSTQSGETEFWKFAANGEGAPEQWTNDAKVLRWEGSSLARRPLACPPRQGSAALDLRHQDQDRTSASRSQ